MPGCERDELRAAHADGVGLRARRRPRRGCVSRASSWLVSWSRSSSARWRGGEEVGDGAPLADGQRAGRR